MSIFGDLLRLPIEIVNIPLKVVDKVLIDEELFSAPLRVVSEVIEDVDSEILGD